jgi:hypothetical protein
MGESKVYGTSKKKSEANDCHMRVMMTQMREMPRAAPAAKIGGAASHVLRKL